MKIDITHPELLVSEQIVRSNLKKMVKRAQSAGSSLRPHFKTHQSRHIGEWCREEGVEAITVSSVGMAGYFADAGWKDILIAFPVNLHQLPEIIALSDRLDRLILMVENEEIIRKLDGKMTAEVVIEVDTGSKRTGVTWEDYKELARLKALVEEAEGLTFSGVYSHAGHAYAARDENEIRTIGGAALDRLKKAGASLGENIPVYFGDTPTATKGDDLAGVVTMTPGNFVFYDTMQVQIGSCEASDIAVCLACPVVSVKPERKEVAVYGGAVHLSKDKLEDGSFGKVVHLTEDGWTEPLNGCYVRAISQEHGIIHMEEDELRKCSPGDILGILPVHSCLTAEAMGGYLTLEGEQADHYRKKRPV